MPTQHARFASQLARAAQLLVASVLSLTAGAAWAGSVKIQRDEVKARSVTLVGGEADGKPTHALVSLDGVDPDVVVTLAVDKQPPATCVASYLSRRGAGLQSVAESVGGAADLTLYDANGDLLAAFAGSLDAAGNLSLFPLKTIGVKGIYSDIGVAGESYLRWRAGMAVTLFGADVGLVAKGVLAVSADTDVAGACLSKTACATADTSKDNVSGAATKILWSASLAFGAVESAWQCALPVGYDATDGVWTLHGKVASWKKESKVCMLSGVISGMCQLPTIDTFQATVTSPWLGDVDSISALPTDDDPLTSIALLPLEAAQQGKATASGTVAAHSVVVVSHGWDMLKALPTHADIELKDGPTLTMSANSYQVGGSAPIDFGSDPTGKTFTLISGKTKLIFTVGSGGRVDILPDGSLHRASGVCQYGQCWVFSSVVGPKGDRQWSLSVTAYAQSQKSLNDLLSVGPIFASITPVADDATAGTGDTKGAPVTQNPGETKDIGAAKEIKVSIALKSDVAIVFAHSIGFSGDAAGIQVQATVTLYTPKAAKGQGDWLVWTRGKLSGGFSYRLGGAGVELSAHYIRGKMEIGKLAPGGGGGIVAGASVGLERVDANGNHLPSAPPAVVFSVNGNGTSTTVAFKDCIQIVNGTGLRGCSTR